MKISIDYGMGKSNIDANGIRYGVISQNSLSSYAMDDVFYARNYLTYQSGLNDLKQNFLETVRQFMDDYGLLKYVEGHHDDNKFLEYEMSEALEAIEERFNERYESDGSESWRYEEGEIQLENCLDYDVIVVHSGYVTLAPLCSPCVPGAGNLDDAIRQWDNDKYFDDWIKNGHWTYALNSDWFLDMNENKTLPFPILSVENFLAGNTAEEFWIIPEYA